MKIYWPCLMRYTCTLYLNLFYGFLAPEAITKQGRQCENTCVCMCKGINYYKTFRELPFQFSHLMCSSSTGFGYRLNDRSFQFTFLTFDETFALSTFWLWRLVWEKAGEKLIINGQHVPNAFHSSKNLSCVIYYTIWRAMFRWFFYSHPEKCGEISF